MKFSCLYIIFVIIALISCTKEDDDKESASIDSFTQSKFVYKILNSDNAYWLITRTTINPKCDYCSNLSLVEGIAYFSDDYFIGKDNLGVILDAEVKDNNLIVITPDKILSYNSSIQSEIISLAVDTQKFKLMDKDSLGNIWILSNQNIFNLEGTKIPFPYNYDFLAFEVSKDSTFWIASNDTIFHVTKSKIEKIGIKQINKNIPSIIYSISIDKNNKVWVNTSDKVFRLDEDAWLAGVLGTYIDDEFKTIPYMGVDDVGNIWIAERNYQSFTHIHCFDGSVWKSYKLDEPITSYINDIELAEAGYIWIGTDTGLIKFKVD